MTLDPGKNPVNPGVSESLRSQPHQDWPRQLIQRHPLGHPHALGLLLPKPFLHDQEGLLGEGDGLP
jgi:hypothetical protein